MDSELERTAPRAKVLKLDKAIVALDHFGDVGRRYILASFLVEKNAGGGEKNKFWSPITFLNTLGALYFGAAGDTKFNLAEELNIGGLSNDEARELLLNFTNTLKKIPYLNSEIAFGLQLVSDEKVDMKPCFLKDVGEVLPISSVRSYNLAEKCDRDTMKAEIDRWILKQTCGVLDTMLDPTNWTTCLGAVIATSAYIKDSWYIFPEEKPAAYTLHDGGEQIETDNLFFEGRFYCGENIDLHIKYAFIPFKSPNLDLMLVHALDGDIDSALAALLRRKGFVIACYESCKRVQANISFPKVFASAKNELKTSICRFGLDDLFSGPNLSRAFTGARTMPIKSVQETLICAIDSIGVCSSVGAAVSAKTIDLGTGAESSSAASCPDVLNVCKPFAFFLCAHKRCVLFGGKVMDPRSTEA